MSPQRKQARLKERRIPRTPKVLCLAANGKYKETYRSRAAARKAIRRVDMKQREYLCSICGRWHLTRKEQKEAKE